MAAPSHEYAQILEREIARGWVELQRQPGGLLLSALAAGLEVGFSVLLVGVVASLFGEARPVAERLAVAVVYPVGFIFVIAGRSELFTEHTTLAVLPVLAGSASVGRLLRVWGLIYAANLVGAFVIGTLVAQVGPAMEVIDPATLRRLGHETTDHAWHTAFLSAVLAGWLMGLLSWLVTASGGIGSRILVVFIVTATIGLAELHHSIVGAAKLAAAWWMHTDRLQAAGTMAWNVFLVSVGNAVGGVVFVALLKFSHARRTGPSAEEAEGGTRGPPPD
ncbi:MAG: formate/nitrite transporter family protein [Myxococcota bacterium]